MSAVKPHIHEHFQQIIWYSLDNNLVNNALFVAERLLALNDRDQNSRHLLGLCFLRAGRASSAYNITNGHRHLGCCYVFAQSCKELGKFREGLLSLENCLTQLPNKWTACNTLCSRIHAKKTLKMTTATPRETICLILAQYCV
jgi:hypothetical protein